MVSALVICGSCGAENAGGARFCLKCGAGLAQTGAGEALGIGERQRETAVDGKDVLSKEQLAAPQVHVYDPPARTAGRQAQGESASHSGSKYGAMRGIAHFCRVISNLFVVVAVLGGLFGLITMTESFFAGAGIIVASAMYGALFYIIFRVMAEGIFVIIDIEANTRRTAEVMEQWVKRS